MKWNHQRLALYDIWKHRPLIIVLIGILVVPLVYSGLYLWAFFDPYANMENLPVAVVNEDQGTRVKGESINAGDEMVENMKEDPKLAWHFVNRAEMKQGFKENKYYMGIVIPADFSEQAASVEKPHPHKGRIQYFADEGSNYLSSQIGKRIIQTLQDEVAKQLSHTYAMKIFEKMGQSAEELAKAAAGATKLAGGTDRAKQGAGKLHSGTSTMLERVESGSAKMNELQQGMNQLVAGIEQMSNELTGAQKEVAEGKRKIEQYKNKVDNLLKIEDGLNEVVDFGDKTAQFTKKMDNLSKKELMTSKKEITAQLQQLQQQEQETDRAFAQLLKDHPELIENPEIKKIEQLHLEKEAVTDELLRVKIPQIEKGIGNIDLAALLAEWKEIRPYIENAPGLLIEAKGQLDELGKKLDKFNELVYVVNHQLLPGAQKLQQGVNQLPGAMGQLASGLKHLDTGLGDLEQGLNTLTSGQNELADKLSQGVKDAKDSLQGEDEKADQIADPIEVDETAIAPVPNYATGFAPYFISLSLWVGAMILFTVIDLKRPVLENDDPLSGTSALAVATVQALLLITVLIYGLGIEPQNTPWLYLFTVLTAFTLTGINHLLITLFKDAGRFLSIILLMLQLTSSGGTYPTEMLPALFQKIHPYLPMTYSVAGLREVLSSGNMDKVMEHATILLMFFLGSYLLKLLYHVVTGKLIPRLQINAD